MLDKRKDGRAVVDAEQPNSEIISLKLKKMEKDQEFVEYVVKALVDTPKAVKANRTIDERGVLITLDVDSKDPSSGGRSQEQCSSQPQNQRTGRFSKRRAERRKKEY